MVKCNKKQKKYYVTADGETPYGEDNLYETVCAKNIKEAKTKAVKAHLSDVKPENRRWSKKIYGFDFKFSKFKIKKEK